MSRASLVGNEFPKAPRLTTVWDDPGLCVYTQRAGPTRVNHGTTPFAMGACGSTKRNNHGRAGSESGAAVGVIDSSSASNPGMSFRLSFSRAFVLNKEQTATRPSTPRRSASIVASRIRRAVAGNAARREARFQPKQQTQITQPTSEQSPDSDGPAIPRSVSFFELITNMKIKKRMRRQPPPGLPPMKVAAEPQHEEATAVTEVLSLRVAPKLIPSTSIIVDGGSGSTAERLGLVKRYQMPLSDSSTRPDDSIPHQISDLDSPRRHSFSENI